MARSSEDWLSKELLNDILLKLPVKSIIRFKTVGKIWCHLFQNVKFIFQHLINVSKKNKQLIVYYRSDSMDQLVYLMRLFVDQSLISYQVLRQQLHDPFYDRLAFEFIVDNGLFCLYDHIKRQLTLCNPALKEFRIFSLCNENIPPKLRTCTNIFGFGLEPLSNDYKVIHIRKFTDKGLNSIQVPHYSIYEMKKNDWRMLENVVLQLPKHHKIYDNNTNACVNGVCYWRTDYNILAFYLGTEVFQLIQLPYAHFFGKMIPLHDCISLWDTEMIVRSDRSNVIWLLNEEGHWTKLLTIEFVLEVERMFGLWKKDRILVESVSGQLLLYDLETNEFSETVIQSTGWRDFLFVFTYQPSLVATRIN